MAAQDFTELVAWQLAKELKAFIYDLIKRPAVRVDQRFCEEAREAARSATRNIAEGFGRYDRKEFAQFLKIAVASEFETRDNILDAEMLGYLSTQEAQHGLRLSRRAVTAATRLRLYLLSQPQKRPSTVSDTSAAPSARTGAHHSGSVPPSTSTPALRPTGTSEPDRSTSDPQHL